MGFCERLEFYERDLPSDGDGVLGATESVVDGVLRATESDRDGAVVGCGIQTLKETKFSQGLWLQK
jgi:hypothetical protein